MPLIHLNRRQAKHSLICAADDTSVDIRSAPGLFCYEIREGTAILNNLSPRRYGQIGLVFLASLLFLHLLSANFDWTRQLVSDMANEPLGLLFVSGTFVHGWGNLSLAFGLRATLKRGPLRALGVALYSLAALGIMTAALFPIDAVDQASTLTGRIHRSAAGGGFLLELVALFVFTVAFGRQQPWREYRVISLLLSVIAAVALTALVFGMQTNVLQGVFERLVLAVFLTWGILVALRLMRVASNGPT